MNHLLKLSDRECYQVFRNLFDWLLSQNSSYFPVTCDSLPEQLGPHSYTPFLCTLTKKVLCAHPT